VFALILDWRVGLCSWAVFLVIVLLTRYVSLGSIIAGQIALPLFTRIFMNVNLATILAVMCGALITIMHIPNIQRLILRKEPKFTIRSRK
jgi:glycerol-3-phosphate acyltransferase PlsY